MFHSPPNCSPSRHPRTIILLAALSVLPTQLVFAADGEPTVDFSRQIRPILSDKCFRCHGPDPEQLQAGLRLDQPEVAHHELESGVTAIMPGDPDHSELIRRIYAEDEAERMPPPDSQKSLSDDEKSLLRKWIAEGGQYTPHWSLVPPRRPVVPQVENDLWSRNEIDRFVLDRLRKEGLTPSPEADLRTLIRRVSFDLTGLPPSVAEVDAFLADDQPGAYERVVDRLLASPRFGERMAVHWLDLARYADSDGYEKDGHRDMWPYRDWVIRAFNANMPFDKFTIEQLAGDMLPDATRDQKIASAFNRNNPTTSEGGADPDEYASKYAVDRATTTVSVWFGLTMQCAECHDHKFDPLTQEDFYRMFAFFNQLPETPLYEGTDCPPTMVVTTPEQEATLASLDEQIVQAKAQLEAEVAALVKSGPQWEEVQRQRYDGAAVEDSDRESLLAEYVFEDMSDHECRDTSGRNRDGVLQSSIVSDKPQKLPNKTAGVIGRGWEFDGNGYFDCGSALSFDLSKGFSYGAWVRPTQQGGVVFSKIDPNQKLRGFDLYMQAGQAIVHLIDSWPDSVLKVTTKAHYVADQWTHVLVTWDGCGTNDSLRIYFNGVPQELTVDINALPIASLENDVPLRIGGRVGDESAMHGRIDEVRIYGRQLSDEESLAAVGQTVRRMLKVPPAERDAEQALFVTEFCRQATISAATSATRNTLAALEDSEKKLQAEIPKLRIMQRIPERRPTHVLLRGDFRNPGNEVRAGIPAVLGSLPSATDADRMMLARWIVSPENPLTARVVVNRLWALCFGTGLVATLSDFGSQGEWPSHPQLLDWLATELPVRGWDMKAMLRLIVTSSTYRQSSRLTHEMAERDPKNRLLARGPRYRLPAEMVRDNALAVSGLLHEQLGGPSVYPYQPAGLWEEMAWAESPWKTWPQSKGADLYRRGLYTFWKRSGLQPVLAIFDAPNRNICEVYRSTTNTPLQAFATLNETSFVESARALAGKMMTARRDEPEQVIDYGYLLAVARPPSQAERGVLMRVYSQMHQHFTEHADEAAALIEVGEAPRPVGVDQVDYAAWTTVAQVILNLDETMTKE